MSGTHDQALDIICAVRALSQRLARAFESVSELTLSQYVLLDQIERRPRSTQHDIADATGIDRSTTSEMIVRLVASGMVMRCRDKRDTRAWEVSITANGRRWLITARKAAVAAADQLIADYPPVLLLARLAAQGAKRHALADQGA